ncbi:MAG: hypothetical protein KIC80_01010 [Brachyspira sp.]|jgi:hypothetical protein|nr:hypothetical protein [Brachyspira sp.]
MKQFTWKAEYSITLIIIFAVFLMLVPTSLGSTVQAKFITKWDDCYSKLLYAKDVISKHEQEDILKSFKRAKTKNEREDLILELIKPYYRLNENKFPKPYKTRFMNKMEVHKNSLYYFKDLYYADNNIIVGLKDISEDKTTEPMFLMMFDMNGKMPPNTWGKDIFGAQIYEDKVEAFGDNLTLQELQDDCSRIGTGVNCSYYYQIGGDFAD